jgi:hypothetical protein
MNKPAIFAVSLLAIVAVVAIPRNSDAPISSNELRATRVSFDANLMIGGEINSATVSLVKREFDAHPKQLFFVEFNSPGGSVDAGIALGRFLREQNAMATVPANSECASSCVFALAGAPTRLIVPAFTDEHGTYFAAAKIGIHRPYLTDTHLTLKEVQKSAGDVETKIRACLREMHVSQRLFDDMMTIPPGQIKWLTTQELALYGLDRDPVVEEAYVLEQARKYGLSRAEYDRRLESVAASCGTSADAGFWDCRDRIVSGRGITDEESLMSFARHCGYEGSNMTMPQLWRFFAENAWCKAWVPPVK